MNKDGEKFNNTKLTELIKETCDGSVFVFSKKIGYTYQCIYYALRNYDEIPSKMAIRVGILFYGMDKLRDMCPSIAEKIKED